MDFLLNMDKTEILRWIFTLLIGGAGWAFAFGRKIITQKVIEEASMIFVKREIYELEMKNVQASITALQLEQKANHQDMINRLEQVARQINEKIDLIMQ